MANGSWGRFREHFNIIFLADGQGFELLGAVMHITFVLVAMNWSCRICCFSLLDHKSCLLSFFSSCCSTDCWSSRNFQRKSLMMTLVLECWDPYTPPFSLCSSEQCSRGCSHQIRSQYLKLLSALWAFILTQIDDLSTKLDTSAFPESRCLDAMNGSVPTPGRDERHSMLFRFKLLRVL
jgi:hypothetical protein